MGLNHLAETSIPIFLQIPNCPRSNLESDLKSFTKIYVFKQDPIKCQNSDI